MPALAGAQGGSAADLIGESVAREMDASRAIPVIIFAEDAVTDVQAALPASADAKALPLIDGVAARLTPEQIEALAADPAATAAIDEIQLDDAVVGLDWPDYLSYTNSAIGLGGVTPAWDGGPTGAGVNVAVLDTGVSAHDDLTGASGLRVVKFKDFVHRGRKSYDDAGHGTFVAGLIAGNGSASLPEYDAGQATTQYRGVAPEAGIVSLKVLDGEGSGRESDVIRAIAWTIKNRQRYDIGVMNISLGAKITAPAEYDPLAMAVEAAWKSGIVVVAAAGNEGEFGPGGILSPANEPHVITVGADDTRQTRPTDDDIICYYSSVGPTLFDEYAKPDVVAPGNRNISLRVPGSFVDTNWPENQIPVADYIPGAPVDATPQYFKLSGTSTSAPVVSGIAALMLDADPTLTPDDIKLRLMETADPLPETSVHQQGAGVVDVPEALTSSLKANGPTLSEDLGDGTTILPAAVYEGFEDYAWLKFKWTKFKWTKFKWTGTDWQKFKWTGVSWDKFKWTKFKWTGVDWDKFKWTKFKWTGTDWQKFKWTGTDWLKFKWTGVSWDKFKWTKFKWTTLDWQKFKWTTLIEGQ
jgi:serine protease AprX